MIVALFKLRLRNRILRMLKIFFVKFLTRGLIISHTRQITCPPAAGGSAARSAHPETVPSMLGYLVLARGDLNPLLCSPVTLEALQALDNLLQHAIPAWMSIAHPLIPGFFDIALQEAAWRNMVCVWIVAHVYIVTAIQGALQRGGILLPRDRLPCGQILLATCRILEFMINFCTIPADADDGGALRLDQLCGLRCAFVTRGHGWRRSGASPLPRAILRWIQRSDRRRSTMSRCRDFACSHFVRKHWYFRREVF